MIRFILCVIVVVGFLILSIPILFVEWIIGKFNPMAKEISSLRIVQAVFRFILWISGVKLTVIGEENVPTDVPVLYIGNHRSFFDVPITYPRCPISTGYIAKKEMEKVPLLSTWMKRLHCLFLDRNDLKQGLKTILTAIEKVKSGISICIFPEGTRTPGDDMLEFKEGSFKIAEKSGCLIIPVAITNTENVFENHIPFIKASTVVIEFGDPIDLKAMPKEERRHIGSQVQSIIGGMLKENSLANVES